MIRRFLSLIICVVFFSTLSLANEAQSVKNLPKLSVSLTPDSIGIGDRVTLDIEVEQDMMQVIAFPEFDMEGETPLELVSEPTLDTIEVDGRRVKLRRRYKLTSFEEGFYNLGRVSILSIDKGGADTIYIDDSLRFVVGTYLIDSTSHSPFDIKPLRTLPFEFDEVSGYTMWGVIALILLAILVVVGLRLMAYFGRPVLGLFKPAPPVAPHVAAFAALESLRSARLWQEGEYKSYYSGLTDILRTYISGRYGVAAMEMTSDEIIAAARELDLPKQCEMEMRDLLRDADLVKFAKAELDASQNEGYFESTRKFVEMTKEEEETEDETEEESKDKK